MKSSKQITRTSLFSTTARCGYARNTIRPTAYGKRWYSHTNNTSRPAFAYMFNTFRRNKFVGTASFGSVLAFGTFYCAEKEKANHSQHRCDGCGMYPISGARYHCVQCKNYDLCESCIEKRTSIHNPSHSFKEFDIIPERDYERSGSSRRYRDFERDLRKQDEDRYTAERFGRTKLNNRSYGNFARNAYEDYEQHPNREHWNRPYEPYTGDDESLKWGYGTPRRNVNVRDDHLQGREEGVYPRKQRYDPGINRRNDMTLEEKQNTRVQPRPRLNEMDRRPSGYDSRDREYQKRMLETERQAGQGMNVSEKAADSYTDHLRRQQGYMNARGTFPGQEEEARRIEVERGREAARPLVQQIKRGPGMHDKYDQSDKYWQSKKGRKELKKEEKERRRDSDWSEGKGRLIGAMH